MAFEVIDNSRLTDIPTDSAILIAGPPMTGKYELLLHLLAHHGDRVILITTKNGHRRILEDFQGILDPIDGSRLGIVDCVSYHQSVDLDEIDVPVKLTNTPENLTRIGVRFTELFDEFLADSEAENIGVGIHSVSQLLMHSEVREVYQFLQVLIGQIRNEGHFVVAVVDVASTDDDTMQVLQHHFDGLINTRENETGTREFRIRGLTSSASPWTEF